MKKPARNFYPLLAKNNSNSRRKHLMKLRWLVLSVFLITMTSSGNYKWNKNSGKNFQSWEWQEINDEARWSARAGLQVLHHNNKFYLMGGRTPIDPVDIPVPGASTIWGDVWRSRNYGRTWRKILNTDDDNHWPARAYFQAVSKGKYMYVLGGQNFNIIDNPGCEFLVLPPGFPCPLEQIPSSDFFNDVWRSKDGRNWKKMTQNAPWEARAGLSAVVYNNEIYIMGGSQNNDCSILPPGSCPPGLPPPRIYYNDVWKSKNGKDWVLLTEQAPWAPRAGGIAIVKDGYLYMIGGEDGFLCDEFNPKCPPYFNDVWRTKDGTNWELVTAEAEWSARPGHQVVVAQDRFVLFGGFGIGFDPSIAANPMDVWTSNKGKVWKKVSDAPWNAISPADIKYDFDALTVRSRWGKSDAIYTFGGDRETFDFDDDENYKKVDNDVWKYALANKMDHLYRNENLLVFYQNWPNPFINFTEISYETPRDGHVQLNIYNAYGKLVKVLVNKNQKAGKYNCSWNGLDYNGKYVGEGMYFARISAGGESKFIKLKISD
jgi:hypothetical protein